MTVYEYSFGLIRLEISFGSPLQEIFYQEISETSDDYPFIRTECVIDTVQATTYLMEAIVNLYRAIDQRGKRCADSDVGCAVNVAGFITCITWVSAYLSLAASSCAQAVNPGALCSADWLTITGAFGEIATAGAAVGTDCDIPAKWAQRFFGIGITTTRRPGICLKRSVCPTDLKCRSRLNVSLCPVKALLEVLSGSALVEELNVPPWWWSSTQFCRTAKKDSKIATTNTGESLQIYGPGSSNFAEWLRCKDRTTAIYQYTSAIASTCSFQKRF